MALFRSRAQTRAKTLAQADSDPTSLGNLLLKKHLLTEDQLADAIEEQVAKTPQLGEICVEHGYLTREQLDDVLFEQRVLRGEAKQAEVIEHKMRAHSVLMGSVISQTNELADLALKLKGKLG